jgi:hypothetical protein
MAVTVQIPPTAGKVQQWLKGPAGETVETSRAKMVHAAEIAVTSRGGARVPSHIAKARGQSAQSVNPASIMPAVTRDFEPEGPAGQSITQPRNETPAPVSRAAQTPAQSPALSKRTQEAHQPENSVAAGKVDTWGEFYYGQVQKMYGLTREDYDKLPQPTRDLWQDTIQAQAILEFRSIYPDYLNTDANFQKIAAELNRRRIPISVRNLSVVYQDLLARQQLDLKPAAAVPAGPAPASEVETTTAPVRTPDVSPVRTVSAPNTGLNTGPNLVRRRGVSSLVPGASTALETDAYPKGISTRPDEGVSLAEAKKMTTKELRELELRRTNRAGEFRR